LTLKWSESEPESTADAALAECLAATTSDEDYEKKIAGLLSRNYAADVTTDGRANKASAGAFPLD
jgi:hypothetical protein